jgi:hypothetical protein
VKMVEIGIDMIDLNELEELSYDINVDAESA